jgi:hypothetical protein
VTHLADWLHVLPFSNDTAGFLLPRLAVNSFFRRFSPELQELLRRHEDMQCFDSPCLVRLPKRSISTTKAFSCPLNAHSVLFRTREAQSALTVSLVERHANHFSLSPTISTNVTDDGHVFVGVSYGNEVILDGQQSSWEGLRGQTTLAVNEWIFVDEHFAYSLTTEPAAETVSDGNDHTDTDLDI